MEILKKLYDYTDYRKFMSDYFSEMKKLKEFFSFRYFASKAGFKAPNFCYYVINGTRNLTNASIEKIVTGMSLKGGDAEYFKLLVEYNQCQSMVEKDELYHKLDAMRRSKLMKELGLKHRAYTAHWYFPVIRELAVYGNWDNNYEKLASMVYPPIKVKQAKEAVENLCKLGILNKVDDRYVQVDDKVSIKDIPVSDKIQIRQEMLLRGYESLDSLAPDERYTAYSTLTLTKDEYSEVTEFLDKMRAKIASDVESKDPDGVYQLMVQLFPVGYMEKEKK